MELTRPTGQDVLGVADAWEEARRSADPAAAPAMTMHAVRLYQSALPHVGGEQKHAVERRLNDLYASANAPRANSKTQFLSELPESNVVAWENWFFKGVDERRQPLRIEGQALPHSLLTHPLSKGLASATYQLGGKALRLRGAVSLDDGARRFRKTPLMFQIYGDGLLLWTSQPIHQSTDKFDVSVQNCNFLELRVLCGDWNGNAHVVWVEPAVTWK